MSLKLISLVAAGMIGALLNLPAKAETTVLLTIDTETRNSGSARQNLWGDLTNYPDKYGVPLILKILDQHRAKATFYVTPYEYVNEHDIADIAKLIVQSGNSVQLHTHPAPMYGKLSMSAYDRATQHEILAKGKQMLESWTGVPIVAHRAGSYAANHDTLEAGAMAGINVDSSLDTAGGSPLVAEGVTANDLIAIDTVTELPVTYYAQVRVAGFESLRALDIESSTAAEIETVIEQMAAERACTVNIMMHSFSFTRYGKPDTEIIERLRQVLDFVSAHSNLRIATVPEFLARHAASAGSCTPTPHFVPVSGVFLTYMRAWVRISEGGENVVVAVLPPLVLLPLAALGFRVWSRRAAQPQKEQ